MITAHCPISQGGVKAAVALPSTGGGFVPKQSYSQTADCYSILCKYNQEFSVLLPYNVMRKAKYMNIKLTIAGCGGGQDLYTVKKSQ